MSNGRSEYERSFGYMSKWTSRIESSCGVIYELTMARFIRDKLNIIMAISVENREACFGKFELI